MISNQLLSHSLSSNAARGFRSLSAATPRPELPSANVAHRVNTFESSTLKTLQSSTSIQQIGSQVLESGTLRNATASSDLVTLSKEGLAKSEAAQVDDETANAASRAEADVVGKAEQQQEKLEQSQIKQLAARDREVRAHEQAHAAVGGSYAGAPSYEFERGPDGVSYAVGGEVQIDVSKASTPAETISKAQQVRRAALAPAEPSPADRNVAAQASRIETQARTELNAEAVKEAELQGEGGTEVQSEGADSITNDANASEVVGELVPGDVSNVGSAGGNALSSANASSNSSFLGQQLRQSILAISSPAERGSIINQVA